MFNKILVLLLFVVLVGCVSTKERPMTETIENELKSHSVIVTKRDLPDFSAMTAGKMMFGLLGAAAMISQGNEIVQENNISDPADYISAELLTALSKKYELKLIDNNGKEVKGEGASDLIQIYTGADFILDMRTINWSFSYFSGDWNNYRVIYNAKLRIIDTKKGESVAEGFCSHIPDKNENGPSRQELLANQAERLKSELMIAANYCISYFKENTLKI